MSSAMVFFVAVLWMLESGRGERLTTVRQWAVGLVFWLLGEFTGLLVVAALVVWLVPPWEWAGPWWAWLPVVFAVEEWAWYWLHRWAHGTRVGWWTHRLHHVPPVVNMAITYVMSPVFVVVALARYVPLLVLGAPLEALGVISFLSVGHSWWVHSGAWFPTWLGRLGIITPHVHEWHHARSARVNYGLVLDWFDRLHGTYYAPVKRPRVGVAGAVPRVEQLAVSVWE